MVRNRRGALVRQQSAAPHSRRGPRPQARGGNLVGRESELSGLRAALTGPPTLVLVEGEAGVGKTRLVQEALSSLPAGRLRPLEVGCLPLQDPFPLGAVVDALHREDLAEIELSPLAGALRPLFPEWADFLPPPPEPLEDPRATRHRLFRAVADLVGRLGVDVLVVDDAHWADSATLELLLMMASAPSAGVGLVVTYRRDEVPDGSLLTRLSAGSSSRLPLLRLSLDPLDPAETRALVCTMVDPPSVSEEFVSFLHERTGGVPLVLEEALSLLRDRGDIGRQGGRWSRRALEELEVPPTVRDSVRERVERLDATARRVLTAAAVLAAPSDAATVGAVAGLDDGRTRRGLSAALDSGLLRDAGPGMVAFRHVLASRAVEETTTVSERRRLHRRAASTLQGVTPVPVARLSRHLREAHDVVAWSEHVESAADTAIESGDDHAAVLMLLELLAASRASALPRGRIARKLGEAAAWGTAALGALAREVVDALRAFLREEAAPRQDRGRVRLLLGRLLLQLGEFESAAAEIESAVDDLDDDPEPAARAMISLAWPRGHAWPAARHREWLERAMLRFDHVPAGPGRTWLEVDRASARLMLGDRRAWEEANTLAGRSATLSEQRQAARCLMNLGHVGIAWGRDEAAREALERSAELMRTTGYQRLLNSCRLTLAYLDWHGGRWAGLSERVVRVAEAEDTLPEARLEAKVITALLHLVAGDRSSATGELAVVLEEATRRGVVDAQMAPAAALARIALAEDRTTDAVELLGPVIDVLVHKDMWLWASEVAPAHVDALVAVGRLRAAEQFSERFARGLAGHRAPAPEAALQICRATVAAANGRSERACAALDDAAATWSQVHRPYARLLTSERLGLVRLDVDREAGLHTLRGVQQELWRLGAQSDADRVAGVLRAHGVGVARTWRGGRRGYGDRLSPRELEVARLVARGLTNREAAQVLYLSPRTVERHLGAAMRKLGVRSRTALAAAHTELAREED